jgi:hypothetical protein
MDQSLRESGSRTKKLTAETQGREKKWQIIPNAHVGRGAIAQPVTAGCR